MRALASIGRVQQFEAITEYNRMKDKLKEYLQTFAVSKKVVTEEDINHSRILMGDNLMEICFWYLSNLVKSSLHTILFKD